MKARTISFTHPVRTGPTTLDRKERLIVEARGSEGITIEVILEQRLVKISNPKLDQTTREPIEVWVPFERVVEWEPLHDRKGKP